MAVREVGYKKTPSKDGSFNPSLCRKVAQRLTRYCEKHGLNKTRFVEDCVSKQMDILERDELNDMPKEMLIELLMSRKED